MNTSSSFNSAKFSSCNQSKTQQIPRTAYVPKHSLDHSVSNAMHTRDVYTLDAAVLNNLKYPLKVHSTKHLKRLSREKIFKNCNLWHAFTCTSKSKTKTKQVWVPKSTVESGKINADLEPQKKKLTAKILS